MYYVYMLSCEGNVIYTGITTDPERRFREHLEGGAKGAKYTKKHKPVAILALWEAEGRSSASKLEYSIKQLTHREKLDLATGKRQLPDTGEEYRQIKGENT